MTRKSMLGLVRRGRSKVRGTGFIVTWDVDSRDRTTANRLWSFVYGRRVVSKGKAYAYPGFVWKEGVRYLGQSTIFVLPSLLPEIRAFLTRNGIPHEIDPAVLP